MKKSVRITPEAKKVHRKLMEFFITYYPEMKGNFLLDNYSKYLQLEKKDSRYILDKSIALLHWLTEWAAIELEEKIYHHIMLGDEIVAGWLDGKYSEARRKVIDALPELYCVTVYKKEIYQLIQECLEFTPFSWRTDYSKCDSFFKLVEMDNLFITANWAVDIIRNACYHESESFMRSLTSALCKPGFKANIGKAEYGLAVILLWHLGGKNLTHDKFLDELIDMGYKKYIENIGTFEKLLYRLGLKKYRKVRHKRTVSMSFR